MYKCQKCRRQVPEKVVQMRAVVRKKRLEKGFQIEEEKKLCPDCHEDSTAVVSYKKREVTHGEQGNN